MSDRIKIDVLFEPYRETWGWVLKGLAFNAITSLCLLGALAVLGKFEGLKQLTEVKSLAVYFYRFNLSDFWFFFKEHVAMGPVAEETFYRLPVFLLIMWNFEQFFDNQKWAKYILWLSLIIPTGFWALDHDLPSLPVFIAGLTYGWLIIKTRPSWPWPAIACHSLSNLSIYVLVKILQVFEYAP